MQYYQNRTTKGFLKSLNEFLLRYFILKIFNFQVIPMFEDSVEKKDVKMFLIEVLREKRN